MRETEQKIKIKLPRKNLDNWECLDLMPWLIIHSSIRWFHFFLFFFHLISLQLYSHFPLSKSLSLSLFSRYLFRPLPHPHPSTSASASMSLLTLSSTPSSQFCFSLPPSSSLPLSLSHFLSLPHQFSPSSLPFSLTHTQILFLHFRVAVSQKYYTALPPSSPTHSTPWVCLREKKLLLKFFMITYGMEEYGYSWKISRLH